MTIYRKTLTKRNMKNIDIINTKKFKDFLHSIVDEHYNITLKYNAESNHNLNYLWYMYYKGTKTGVYRPFILMAEMHLLKEMGFMQIEDIQNINSMLQSEDKDNFYIAYLAVKSYRDNRIKKHGKYTDDNVNYINVGNDYSTKILNSSLFQNALKLQIS